MDDDNTRITTMGDDQNGVRIAPEPTQADLPHKYLTPINGPATSAPDPCPTDLLVGASEREGHGVGDGQVTVGVDLHVTDRGVLHRQPQPDVRVVPALRHTHIVFIGFLFIYLLFFYYYYVDLHVTDRGQGETPIPHQPEINSLRHRHCAGDREGATDAQRLMLMTGLGYQQKAGRLSK
jgi:hypothetical protein